MTISSPIGVAILSIRKSSGSAMVGHPEMLCGIGVPRPPCRRRIGIERGDVVSRSHSPGARRPGRLAISGASLGSRARWLPMVAMSAPRSNTRFTRATMAGNARTSGNSMVTATALRSGRWATATLPRLPSSSMRRCHTPSSIHSSRLSARSAQRVEHAGPVVGRAIGEAERHGVARRVGRARFLRGAARWAAGRTSCGRSR